MNILTITQWLLWLKTFFVCIVWLGYFKLYTLLNALVFFLWMYKQIHTGLFIAKKKWWTFLCIYCYNYAKKQWLCNISLHGLWRWNILSLSVAKSYIAQFCRLENSRNAVARYTQQKHKNLFSHILLLALCWTK